jgi:AraC-like DNA-binding protein
VHGVASRHIERVLEGRDRVVGMEFRPGAFRPFLQAPVATLTDRAVPAADVPGLPPGRPAEPLDAAAVERWLATALPRPDPDGRRAGEAVALVAAEPGIMRVDQLAARCRASVRGLQRLSAEQVGIGPKWVIRRYRLHEVTGRMAAGRGADWATVAAELGYADQAHLTRDFTAMFGEPPTAYAARY